MTVIIDVEGDALTIDGIDLKVKDIGPSSEKNVLIGGHDLRTTAAAVHVFPEITAAINQLASDRAMLGAYQTRLNYTADQLAVSKQNLMAANSRIRDVDVAEESTQYAKESILVQSGTAMLTQANQMPQTFLRLLQ